MVEDDNVDPGSSAPAPATLFGKYEVGKLVGRGAFAKVYHARNVGTGQSVAIKAVSKQKVLKSGLGAHVKREVSIMRRLRHPHIVTLHEMLATKTKAYFVMEFAKGGELFAKVAEGGRFSEDLSRRYFRQLISAVGYCHSRGVFHRDLKPENVLLDENFDLKVTDFGLSAVNDQIASDGLLHTLCGTPAYVAPEILAKKGYAGASVDVWSCGVILYVLNAGYLPFNDPNLMAMYRKIYRGEYRCPKWMPPDLRRFLSRLLDPNPETRITVDGIIRDPWFSKGCRSEMRFHEEEDHSGFDLKEDSEKKLNAFDLISLSPGFDLSGLFEETEVRSASELFATEEPPERIIGKLEEVAKAERVTVAKKREWGLKLQGQNGGSAVIVEIYRLTEKLFVVETKFKRRDGAMGPTDFWKDKVRPHLSGLIYQPGVPVAGA